MSQDGLPEHVITPEVVAAGENPPAIHVEPEETTRGVVRGFDDALKQYDNARSGPVSLYQVWTKCMEVHADHAMLRTNLKQMQVMFQDEMTRWAEIRASAATISERLAKCENDELADTAQRLLNEVIRLNIKQITMLSRQLNATHKEVRQTEFQQKFWFHANIVNRFLAGVTAILFKHLQADEKLQAITKDMMELAKMFDGVAGKDFSDV